MMSSRCPRPIGTSESMALRPVCIGSLTDLRGMMPGAFTSTRVQLHIFKRALAVDGIAERIDNAAEQALADRHFDDRAGTLDDIAFADRAVIAEDDDADIVGFEVERHAFDAALEFDHFAGANIVEPINRATPSPTESTCPTSATSAIASKFAISFLRMEEISETRISIRRPSLSASYYEVIACSR